MVQWLCCESARVCVEGYRGGSYSRPAPSVTVARDALHRLALQAIEPYGRPVPARSGVQALAHHPVAPRALKQQLRFRARLKRWTTRPRASTVVLKWLHEHRTEGCSTEAMDVAAEFGHLDVLEWMHVNDVEGFDAGTMDAAARGGQLEILQWLHANRFEGCTTLAMAAVSNGNFEAAMWLCAQQLQVDARQAAFKALYCRHYELLQWLLEQYPDQTQNLRPNDVRWFALLERLRVHKQ